jgi:outer membrane receptor for ferrienterochelin and colicin
MARASENSLLVNGSYVTDPVTGEFAMDIPVEAIENIQTFTNSYSAEYGKYTGGLVNIATLPGDNKWRFKFNTFVPRFRFHRYSVAGVSAFTPHLIISGPIIHSKLFFSQSFNVNFIRTTLKTNKGSGRDISFQDADEMQITRNNVFRERKKRTFQTGISYKATSWKEISRFGPIATSLH